MNKKYVITAALISASITNAYATTTIGGATLIDTAVVHSGTVSPTTYLSYVSGGNGATGWADGSTWGGSTTPAAAMSTADHYWLQYDPAILMYSATPLSSVIAIPAIDHGWTSGNTGEFWEAFEFKIYGCSATGCLEEGKITQVWERGVDDTGPMKNADDWTTQWSFTGSYNYFAVISGDRLVGGPFSPGEGEIDALAAPIPEPETYAMLLAGLGLLGFMARRKSI